MKKLFVGVALVAAIAACKSQTNTSTSDATQPAVKSECCSEGAAKSECAGEQKADCGKVCPVTGQKMN